MKLLKFTFAGLLSTLAFSALAQSVEFVTPKNSAVVTSPFKVQFAVDGMKVAPAGQMMPESGHHHLLINTGAIATGENIPMDDTHKHYGKGQTDAEITLAPGKYKLTMQFANGAHQSYGEKMSKTIDVTVK
jgi:hypothetical protein